MNKPYGLNRDGDQHRLLLFLKKQTGLPFEEINPIKKGVWLIRTKKKKWVVKEYISKERVLTQIDFTNELQRHGFWQTYLFYPKVFQKNQKYLALIEYIEPSFSSFYYNQQTNIIEAILLLDKFHNTTKKLVHTFHHKIPENNQLAKFENRLDQFHQSIRLYRVHSAYSHLKTMYQYGEWAINKLHNYKAFVKSESPVILHGDVASHNFIKSTNGHLYLIDFDLISIGSPAVDFLQLSNRILPYLQWDGSRLFTLPRVNDFAHSLPFLIALVYPADIFREWLHFSKLSPEEQKTKWPFLKKLLFRHYKQRMQFYDKIKQFVSMNH